MQYSKQELDQIKTLKRLKEIAKELNVKHISKYSKENREDLIQSILAAQSDVSNTPDTTESSQPEESIISKCSREFFNQLQSLSDDKKLEVLDPFYRNYVMIYQKLNPSRVMTSPDDIPVVVDDLNNDIQKQTGFLKITSSIELSEDEMKDLVEAPFNESNDRASTTVEFAEKNIRRCLGLL